MYVFISDSAITVPPLVLTFIDGTQTVAPRSAIHHAESVLVPMYVTISEAVVTETALPVAFTT